MCNAAAKRKGLSIRTTQASSRFYAAVTASDVSRFSPEFRALQLLPTLFREDFHGLRCIDFAVVCSMRHSDEAIKNAPNWGRFLVPDSWSRKGKLSGVEKLLILFLRSDHAFKQVRKIRHVFICVIEICLYSFSSKEPARLFIERHLHTSHKINVLI